jgi:tRNA (guanine-N7-)-methyltransferase
MKDPSHGGGKPSTATIRSYVLRTRRIGSGQRKALESLAPDYVVPFEANRTPGNLAHLWPDRVRYSPLIVDIGFGMGESLAEMAANRRDHRFLGIEVHPPGVGSMLQRIEALALDHVRIVQHDAVAVLQAMLGAASVDAFHVYFPDPWPKKRHHKRRLIQRPFAELLASRLRPHGYLHCATDWEPYAKAMLECLSQIAELRNSGAGFHPRPGWRPLTRFERRGLQLGHKVRDLIFRRI